MRRSDLRVSLGRYDEESQCYEAQVQIGAGRPMALPVHALKTNGVSVLEALVEFRSMHHCNAVPEGVVVRGTTPQAFVAALKREVREQDRSNREPALPVARGQWSGGKLSRNRRVA